MSTRIGPWVRFGSAAILLLAAISVLRLRDNAEILPAHRALSSFPEQIGDWQGFPLPITTGEQKVLGPGDFLLREYRSPTAPAPVELYVAYFSSQRTGDTIHSPKNCLPGAGWSPLESGRLEISNADGSTMSVNRYIVAKGLNRALALYWYQAHGRVTASDYVAKFRLVEDAIRLNRTDGSLVRVVVPFADNHGERAAQATALVFIARMEPTLQQYIPR
ncbi:MAG TPA: EpsI family protein [Candidatus Cybelea sp.]|nr:EpsI family protein [Candidatus Cybelea sp.]